MEFYIDAELREFGHTEDMEVYFGNVYFIMAEYPDGRRYAHRAEFAAVVATYDDEGILRHTDVEKEALAKAETILLGIDDMCITNKSEVMNHWKEKEPRYGSSAWIRYEG